MYVVSMIGMSREIYFVYLIALTKCLFLLLEGKIWFFTHILIILVLFFREIWYFKNKSIYIIFILDKNGFELLVLLLYYLWYRGLKYQLIFHILCHNILSKVLPILNQQNENKKLSMRLFISFFFIKFLSVREWDNNPTESSTNLPGSSKNILLGFSTNLLGFNKTNKTHCGPTGVKTWKPVLRLSCALYIFCLIPCW